MSTPITPYSGVLAGRDPFAAIHESIEAIRRFTAGSTGERFERSYAPGKWTARQLLIHLAETEIALGNRARMALVTPNYVAQLWDQDTWMPLDARLTGPLASEVFVAVAAMNLSFFRSPVARPARGLLRSRRIRPADRGVDPVPDGRTPGSSRATATHHSQLITQNV